MAIVLNVDDNSESIPLEVNSNGGQPVSPTVQLVTVPGGVQMTVTDVNGTQTALIPKGEDGADGAPGADGSPGPAGADGYSPSVSVEAITGGHRVTVTDSGGNESFDVLDGAEGYYPPQTVQVAAGADVATPVIDMAVDVPGSGVYVAYFEGPKMFKMRLTLTISSGGTETERYWGLNALSEAVDHGYILTDQDGGAIRMKAAIESTLGGTLTVRLARLGSTWGETITARAHAANALSNAQRAQTTASNALTIANAAIPEPENDGTTGQALITDGAGGRSWATVGGGTITDVQINGASAVTEGVASIPKASNGVLGCVKGSSGNGITIDNLGQPKIYKASLAAIKFGASETMPIVPQTAYAATFYGLARAAGDSSQYTSQNEVGTYTDDAKSAILQMLGIDAIIGPAESSSRAGNSYAAGECFIYSAKLYRATAAITAGDTITPGTNCEQTNLMAEILRGI